MVGAVAIEGLADFVAIVEGRYDVEFSAMVAHWNFVHDFVQFDPLLFA